MATFALPDLSILINDIVGGTFALLAVVNFFMVCWKKPAADVAKKQDADTL